MCPRIAAVHVVAVSAVLLLLDDTQVLEVTSCNAQSAQESGVLDGFIELDEQVHLTIANVNPEYRARQPCVLMRLAHTHAWFMDLL